MFQGAAELISRPVRFLPSTDTTGRRWTFLFAAGDEIAVQEAIARAPLPSVELEHPVEPWVQPAAWP